LCFFTSERCSLPAGQSISENNRWETDSAFSQATVSGPYSVGVSLTACPTTAPCLETVGAGLRVVVSVPQN
jgi:hypothetical protein